MDGFSGVTGGKAVLVAGAELVIVDVIVVKTLVGHGSRGRIGGAPGSSGALPPQLDEA